jgi:rubrerythrin
MASQRSSPVTAPQEAVDRLLRAWRGEIVAGAVYELIARRERDPRRAEILRRMAAAESGHRERIERRLGELGHAVPDPATVRVSPWLRMQARVAPVDRLVAAREAAEDDEVDDLYKRPTGDPETDRLLHAIRREERSHSLAVADMRSGDGDRSDPSPVAVPGARARLDRILHRETWHQTGGSWISGAIYGPNTTAWPPCSGS